MKKSLIKILRETTLLSMLAFCLWALSAAAAESSGSISSISKDFFMGNGYMDTGASNIVAAIYLDYRLLDSIFESSLLLVTIAGVLHISKSEDSID
ncbi:hypothetical protein SAMN02745945_01912 [Peptoclostridium litorale DSM 5388]|uniref:Uncharacterized protein n=1 Tax=Peptoclostridium litorale DSM 5388 TaxID=1121324 RepID=A0A069RPT6_PEPLI|nr:hypothetical protein [Peptoclostridium litorale]KDR96182.1 hypothetical protein CLIT_4c00190 [Peptoclostridium litorale DSM 5388]SIO13097.1 hypothetical protein SAMN02745945_01912 [Peptoclostridium litorale DSM 5388]